MIRWTGLAPWEFEFLLPGSLTSTFLRRRSGIGIQDSRFEIRVSGFGVWVSGFGFQVSGSGLRDSEFGIRSSGFGVGMHVCTVLECLSIRKQSDIESRISVLRFRDSGSGIRDSEFGIRSRFGIDG